MSDVDVIVVGAGAAGLGAARHLLAAGKTIAVLEARDRIGGRAWSETGFFGQTLDHGASFIHAEDANPWTSIARRLGFQTVVDPRRRHLFVDGQPASADMMRQFMDARAQALDQVLAVETAGQDKTITDALHLEGVFAPQARASLAPWLLGADNDGASAIDFARGVSGEDRLVPDGYGELVAAYGLGVPVHLNTMVTAVDYKSSGVAIHSNRGTIRGKQAIITLPVGVFAAERVDFRPSLPLEKHQAIDGLPMGLLAKIMLVFDGDPFGLGDSFYLHEKTETDRAALYLCRPAGRSYVIAFVGGSLARELEEAGEDAAQAFALAPLRALFGQRIDMMLLGSRQTGWGRDPFALGSYAVAKPHATEYRAVLARPIDEKIFFAGEAVAANGWAATVAGAYRSGRKVAHDIISYT